MNKIVKGVSVIVVTAFLFGTVHVLAQNNGDEENDQEANINPEVENTENEQTEKNDQAKDNQIPEVSDELAGFIAEQSEKLHSKSDDPRLKEAGNDEGFNYYLNVNELYNGLNRNQISLVNEPEAVKKDWDSIFQMKSVIGHYQFVRTAHLGMEGQAKEDVSRADQWKPVEDDMRKAYDYVKQIIHDLDIAFNHDGKGETYDVTDTLNGERASEVRRFFQGGSENIKNLNE